MITIFYFNNFFEVLKRKEYSNITFIVLLINEAYRKIVSNHSDIWSIKFNPSKASIIACNPLKIWIITFNLACDHSKGWRIAFEPLKVRLKFNPAKLRRLEGLHSMIRRFEALNLILWRFKRSHIIPRRFWRISFNPSKVFKYYI